MDAKLKVDTDLIEQVTCKKCNNVIFRTIEQYKIYTEKMKENETTDLYALFVKKFVCPKCGSTEYHSELVSRAEHNIIDFNTVSETAAAAATTTTKTAKRKSTKKSLKTKKSDLSSENITNIKLS